MSPQVSELADDILKRFDANHDGKITRDEFSDVRLEPAPSRVRDYYSMSLSVQTLFRVSHVRLLHEGFTYPAQRAPRQRSTRL